MRRRRQVLQVSTFPFLAVLLCAMGSLILLLLVIDRRARAVARAKAVQAASRVAEENTRVLAARKAEWERRRRALHARLAEQDREVWTEIGTIQDRAEAGRRGMEAELSRYQSLEKELRDARARLSQGRGDLTTRQATADRQARQTAAGRKELVRLTEELGQLEQTLEDLKRLRKQDQQTYSLVPYRGRRGDNRRPIYVECTADGLIFHPEQRPLLGARMTAAAVYAEVERQVARGRPSATAGGDRKSEAPYLLMLVRPDGIMSYYRALAALQGFHFDFGYEFVEKDWVLDFSEPGDKAGKPGWMTAAGAKARPTPAARKAKPSSPLVGTGWPGGAVSSTSSAAVSGPIREGEAPAEPGAGGSAGASPSPGGATQGGHGSRGSPGGPGAGTGRPAGPGDSSDPRGRQPAAGSLLFQNPAAVVGAAAPDRVRGVIFGGGPDGEKGGGFPGPPGAESRLTGPNLGDGKPPGANTLLPGGGAIAAAQEKPGAGINPGRPGPLASAGPGPTGEAAVAGTPPSASSGEVQAPCRADFQSARPAGRIGNPPYDPKAQGEAQGAGTTNADQSPPFVLSPDPETGAPALAGSQGEGAPSGTGNRSQLAGSAGRRSGQPAPAGYGPRSGAGPEDRGEASGSPAGDDLTGLLPRGGRSSPARRPPASLPRLGPNRDWVIPVECTAAGVVLRTARLRFATPELSAAPGGSHPLVQAVREMIARRQATVRAGEPPYRPMIRFQVRPEGLRSYYLAYPLLQGLRVPMARQDLEPDEPEHKDRGKS
jgi:hypothetical protein